MIQVTVADSNTPSIHQDRARISWHEQTAKAQSQEAKHQSTPIREAL